MTWRTDCTGRVADRPPDRYNMTNTITIPQWHPARLNQLLNCHWSQSSKIKATDKYMVLVNASCQGVPKVTLVRGGPSKSNSLGPLLKGTGPRRRVSLHLTMGKGERRGDRDGYWKSVLDALVHCGRLVNDSPVWSEQGDVTFDRGERKTVITLEDLA